MALVESGGRVVQETRLYNPDCGETATMRSKEEAHDYRYFPEPDLVPLRIAAAWLEELRAALPELPARKRARFVAEYGLPEYDAEVLTATRAASEYFETAARVSGDPKTAANWVMGDLMGMLKADGKEIAESPVSAGTSGRTGEADRRRASFPASWPRRFFPRCFRPARRRPRSWSAKG